MRSVRSFFIGIVGVLFLNFSSVLASERGSDFEERYYVVPYTYLQLLDPVEFRPNLLGVQQDLVLVKLDYDQMIRLGSKIHEVSRVCGGFFDVTEEFLKDRKAGHLLQSFRSDQKKLLKKGELEIGFDSQVQEVLSKIESQHFLKQLEEFSSFSDRAARSELGKEASDWIKNRIQGWVVEHGRSGSVGIETFATSSKYVQPSLVVKIAGKNASLPGVLLGAHIDTYEYNKPGADDDGSGTSAILEVLKAVLSSKMEFQRNLYFAFYAAEEVGLLGSSRVSSAFEERGIELRGVLQLDMIGYRSPDAQKKLYLLSDYTDPDLTEFMRKLATHYVGISSDMIGSTYCGYACSDHASWHRRGYPTALPFEADFDEFNPYIHSGRDGMDLIDLDHAMNFVRLAAAFAVEGAEPTGER